MLDVWSSQFCKPAVVNKTKKINVPSETDKWTSCWGSYVGNPERKRLCSFSVFAVGGLRKKRRLPLIHSRVHWTLNVLIPPGHQHVTQSIYKGKEINHTLLNASVFIYTVVFNTSFNSHIYCNKFQTFQSSSTAKIHKMHPYHIQLGSN